jgi:hypothetical protein
MAEQQDAIRFPELLQHPLNARAQRGRIHTVARATCCPGREGLAKRQEAIRRLRFLPRECFLFVFRSSSSAHQIREHSAAAFTRWPGLLVARVAKARRSDRKRSADPQAMPRPIPAPKGRNKIAQGEALGLCFKKADKPWRGETNLGQQTIRRSASALLLFVFRSSRDPSGMPLVSSAAPTGRPSHSPG